MNINRNNYEEFFLLYIDNELPIGEKNIVDTFVADNPDLAEELLMLQQSIIKPDAIIYPEKESLAKPFIPATDIEEKLLLLLDDELPVTDKQEMLRLIESNPSVQQAWEVIQLTKLPTKDSYVFDDKKLLYRQEASRVPIAWWRMAAAASILGLGIWGTVSYINRNEVKDFNNTNMASTTTISKELTGTNTPIDSMPANPNTNSTLTTKIGDKQKNTVATYSVKQTTKKTTQPWAAANQSNKPIIATAPINTNDNSIAPENLNIINNPGSNEKLIVNVSPQTNIQKPENPIEINLPPQNKYASTAALNTTNGQEYASFEEEDNKPRSTKLGGFFKKVKRQIERKTKIKTGNDDEVRIANMSFAMH